MKGYCSLALVLFSISIQQNTLVCEILTLKVLVMTVDALGHF